MGSIYKEKRLKIYKMKKIINKLIKNWVDWWKCPSKMTIPKYVYAEGKDDDCTCNCSHAEGNDMVASFCCCYIEGNETTYPQNKGE